MKKWIYISCVFFLNFLLENNILAEDLMAAYQQALKSDPTFQTAEFTWQATKKLIPINRAPLLPNISGSAGLSRSYEMGQQNQIDASYYQTTKQYGLTLQQSIFDYGVWSRLSNASAQVKQGYATYNAAQQDLMLRLATAYLAVLQAYDEWVATEAQKRSLAQQLEQTQAQYKAGLIAITGVEQVKASFDAIVSQEITNKNNISNKLEELRAITGSFYTKLAGLTGTVPLIPPVPSDINAWVKTAGQQNYNLQAAHYAMVAAHENIQIQRAGHFPTVTATGSYTGEKQSVPEVGGFQQPGLSNNSRAAVLGVSVALPIFQGGLVNAQTQQAAAQYAKASAQKETTYRTVLTQARESYLGVISGISKLKADKQAVVSNQSSLSATQAGYTAGNNTIVDVLQQQSNLYAAQTTYTVDQYNYLISILDLKSAAGTLSPADLSQINTWLKRDLDLSDYDFNTAVASSSSTPAKPKVKTRSKIPIKS